MLAAWTAIRKMKRFVIKRTLDVKAFNILCTIMSNIKKFQELPTNPVIISDISNYFWDSAIFGDHSDKQIW